MNGVSLYPMVGHPTELGAPSYHHTPLSRAAKPADELLSLRIEHQYLQTQRASSSTREGKNNPSSNFKSSELRIMQSPRHDRRTRVFSVPPNTFAHIHILRTREAVINALITTNKIFLIHNTCTHIFI